MDFPKEGTLKNLITKNNNLLNEETALTILDQILLSLDFIHQRGLILCQIAPDSIFIKNIQDNRSEIECFICDLSKVMI